MAIYFFYGEEDFDIENEIRKLKKGLDKNFLEMSYQTYDNPKFSDLISILRSQPMMFGRMLIVINCINYLFGILKDEELNEIEKALKNNNENVDIVFYAMLVRNDGRKFDARKRFYKILKNFNTREFPLVPTYKTNELETRIGKMAKEKGLILEKEAFTAIINQLGNNFRQINQELDKLKVYAYPKDLITSAMVKEICVSNEDLFALSDFLMENRKDKAILEYRKLLNSRHPLEVLMTLQAFVRRWIILKAKANTTSTSVLSKLTGVHEYVVKITLQGLKNTPLKELVRLKHNLTDAEYRIKSGQIQDVEKEIENAIFR